MSFEDEDWLYGGGDEPATVQDRVLWFGVAFRSSKHLSHFRNSMLLFCSIVVVAWLLPAMILSVAVPCGLAHATIAIVAVRETRWGRINGKRFSRDCIWFNALLVMAYVGIATYGFRSIVQTIHR